MHLPSRCSGSSEKREGQFRFLQRDGLSVSLGVCARELILAALWIWRRGQQGGKSRMRWSHPWRGTLGGKCKQILNGGTELGQGPLYSGTANSYKLGRDRASARSTSDPCAGETRSGCRAAGSIAACGDRWPQRAGASRSLNLPRRGEPEGIWDDHGWPFPVQEHHAPQGPSGRGQGQGVCETRACSRLLLYMVKIKSLPFYLSMLQFGFFGFHLSRYI